MAAHYTQARGLCYKLRHTEADMRRVAQSFILATTLWLLVAGVQILAQTPPASPPAVQTPAAPAPSAAPTEKPEDGIPITDATVQKACAPCHTRRRQAADLAHFVPRNTPEGWQETIRRMVALNGLRIDPQTAREVVKYLSNHLGLAPEEARPAAFEVERRMHRLTSTPPTPTPRASATSATRWAA